jgi:hypothetical protein
MKPEGKLPVRSPKRDEVQREEEARSPPNDWSLEVADSTEEAVCESIWITRIQPTPKSFGVDTIDVVTLQTVDCLKNCAAQDSREMMMMSFICPCRNKNQPEAIYPKGTSHHTTLFRGPSTNDMKK